LPSGGKFTHGTSGSISIDKTNPNKPIMNVSGNGANSVIQWGGGFNIANGEKVNFGNNNFKGQQNYLNIAHGTSKSTIEGILNAGGNNVFLINPNGVIIEKSGSIINANRFVASTSSMSDDDMWKFAKLTKEQGASFSPVFKPQKAGNVVNMGNINADDVLLIGNKVDMQGGKVGNKNSITHLVGNYVYIDADSTNLHSTINVTAVIDGYIQRQMINFANSGYNFGDDVIVNAVDYQNHIGNLNFKRALTIGNMGNEKDNAIEWWHFAKGWNEGLGYTRFVDEFRLVGDIDFGGDQGKNYANYCIEGNNCTNMIVAYKDAFNKTFDGQGYTLKNINIDTTKNQVYNVGIFGISKDANFKNINIDYNKMGIKSVFNGEAESLNIGGFIGSSLGSNFNKITVKNITNITGTTDSYNVFSVDIGGFIGSSYNNNFSNIYLDGIKKISGLQFKGIASSSGGFAGTIGEDNFNKISLNNIGEIYSCSNGGDMSSFAGGFIGNNANLAHNFENIYLYFDKGVNINAVESTGKFLGINMSPASLNFKNIHIYHHENDLSNATTDQSYWGNTNDKINIHTYNDSTQSDAYKDFLSKANTIEKPSKPSKPTDPIDPTDPDVILDDDDLYANVIMEWIINEIRGVEHIVSVEDLKKLADFINAFKGLDKDSSEAEIKAVVKTHLGIDGDKALSIAQSISFLLNYQEHNFDGRLSEKAKTIYDDIIKPNVSNTLGLISYLDKNQAYLLEQYNKYKELEQIFKDKEQAYFTAEAEFNRLLDLVNKGKLSYNDPKFTQAFDNRLNAYNSYNALSNDISDLNANVASINKGIENLGYTKFSFAKFDDITKIHLVEPK
ncbi:filamentous hemagglutinin N-terminal domain-containing protein, partial [Campylobacter sp. IFREMER_LSEM_CL2256]|uniref:two-partner secretion domain-containing protein n=1 Tax=Campylobacter sp. IFREMER_LSEM_CL2256 TaxID=2911622 RepID=UPI0021E853ED